MLHPGARTLKAADGDFRFCPARTCDELCGKGEAAECLEALAVRMTEQGMIIRFDGPVAFADGLLQGFNIGDLNMAPRIFYHSGLLKCARMQRHAGSLDAQHLSKKFLGELQTVRARQVS